MTKRIGHATIKLMTSLGGIYKSFGGDVVRYGVQDYGNKWQLKGENLSKCYTTRFDELPKAKAR